MFRKNIRKVLMVTLLLSFVCNVAVYAETNEEVAQADGEAAVQALAETTIPGQWIQSSNGQWWYKHNDGTYTKNDWEYIDGKWYYFDANGWMQKGWVYVKGGWFYLGTNGAMCTGWLKLDGHWYYLSDSGRMCKGWWKVEGKWYYFAESGVMQTGWLYVSFPGFNGDLPYYNYFNTSGVFVTDSDCRGCEHGYSTFGDQRYSVAPDRIRYRTQCSAAQNVEISKACTDWNKNEVSQLTEVPATAASELYFYPESFDDKRVLAKTYFSINGEWGNPMEANWPATKVGVSTDHGTISAGTIAHEIGHAYGLSHRISNKNSIMCQLGNGRIVNTVQPTDLEVLRHIY